MRKGKGYDLETTPLQNQLFVLLTNPQNPKRPRSQREVSVLLDIPKSTISENVKKLIDKEFITESFREGKEVFYRAYKHQKLIKLRIPIDTMAYGVQFDTNGRAIGPLPHAELREDRKMEPYQTSWRSHLNGGWLMFQVEKLGVTGWVHISPDGKTQNDDGSKIEHRLFGDAVSWPTKGSTNFGGVVDFLGTFYEIRLQKTSKGNVYFYIAPKDEWITADSLTPDGDLTPFIEQVLPVLEWIELAAGWTFRRKPDKSYECLSNMKKGRGIVKEYGADSFLTELLLRILGPEAINQLENFWYDTSPNAQGDGEVETNKAEFADAIDKLVQTKKKADKSADRQETLRLIAELREDLNATISMIVERLDVVLPPEYKAIKKEPVVA